MADSAGKKRVRDLAIAVPAVFLAVVAGLAVVNAAGRINRPAVDSTIDIPQTVLITPRSMTYRADGDFQRNSDPVDAPLITRALAQPFEIMKYQVTSDDYQRCIDDGGCQPAETGPQDGGAEQQELPIVGVSYTDAQDYAAWLSKKTGQSWSLPTDEQWAFAAGSRFPDDGLGLDGDEGANPALRWLRDYEQQSARKKNSDPAVRQAGAFGENELGVADIGGNVWEWTQTCHRRVNMDDNGKIVNETPVCGVYVINGKHRAAMSSFIRNPKSGGCSVGLPPDNLGFRLVRDKGWIMLVLKQLKDIVA